MPAPGEYRMSEQRFDKGILLMHMERFDEAVDFFNEFVETHPSDGAAWQKLAASYVGGGDTEEGRRCAEKALELDPNDPEVLVLLGSIHSLSDRDDGALDYFDRAIEADSGLIRAWISKVVTLRSLGRGEEAKDSYRLGVMAAPTLRDPEYWSDVAGPLYDEGMIEETIELFDFLLELEPEEIVYKFNKLGPLARMRRYDDVLDLVDEVIEAAPAAVPAWMVKGITLLALGRYDEAVECFDRVLTIDPSNADALDMKRKTLQYLEKTG